jgi:arylsulfatase A-like enzyme
VNKAAGRDHWNFCYGLMLAGGGIKPGVVYGASDRIGGRPSNNPVGPADVVATIYQCLGVAHDVELRDRLDRPFQLVPWGQPIRELLA